MQISKKSWMYKVAYGLSDNEPEVTNLCDFFWKTVFMLIIGWPFFLVISLVLCGLLFMFGFLVGERPNLFGPPNDNKEIKWVSYKHWPTVGGERVLPIGLIFSFFGGFFGWFLMRLIVNNAKNIFLAITPLLVFLCIIAGCLGLVLILCVITEKLPREYNYYVRYKLLNSEFYKLIKEYVSAKKQKICPIIHFTE